MNDSQVFRRMMQLEVELRVAAAVVDELSNALEREGFSRFPVVTELQYKWRTLLDEQPVIAEEHAA